MAQSEKDALIRRTSLRQKASKLDTTMDIISNLTKDNEKRAYWIDCEFGYLEREITDHNNKHSGHQVEADGEETSYKDLVAKINAKFENAAKALKDAEAQNLADAQQQIADLKDQNGQIKGSIFNPRLNPLPRL